MEIEESNSERNDKDANQEEKAILPSVINKWSLMKKRYFLKKIAK
jgi:hypothetical protein